MSTSSYAQEKRNIKRIRKAIALRREKIKMIWKKIVDIILYKLSIEYEAPVLEVATSFGTEVSHSTGAVAASFTSTAMVPKTINDSVLICENELKYQKFKKRGYVRLITNFGSLNFELYCDVAPKACENFIRHCNDSYYNGTKFHRSIRNSMIHGGYPTGSGVVGGSVQKKPFEGEMRSHLHHLGRGVLSMASESQFLITYRSCRQLDGKHTVFGKLLDGMVTLNAMEQIAVDNDYRPIYDIIIKRTCVLVDPFIQAEQHRAAVPKRKAEDDELGATPKKACVLPHEV